MNPNKSHWWQRRSGRIVAEIDVLCICAVILIMTVPALADTTIPIPFTSTVINVGDIPPWIMAGVVLITWWEARAARKEARIIGTKIDGMLVDRDKAKVAEGEEKGKQAGVVAAEQLAEGQRQGRESERESAAAQVAISPGSVGDVKQPIPVKDDRTAVASERVADAAERTANATSRVADAAEVKPKQGS